MEASLQSAGPSAQGPVQISQLVRWLRRTSADVPEDFTTFYSVELVESETAAPTKTPAAISTATPSPPTPTPSPTPVDVVPAVSAGATHSCTLTVKGEVVCWGDDSYGQSSTPPGRFIAVSAGYGWTCGIRGDHTVACWGWNRDGGGQAAVGRVVRRFRDVRPASGRRDSVLGSAGQRRHQATVGTIRGDLYLAERTRADCGRPGLSSAGATTHTVRQLPLSPTIRLLPAQAQ
jgi:hypothetical protein